MIQSAKIIGTGLATTDLMDAGVGIGVVLGALIFGVAFLILLIVLAYTVLISNIEIAFGHPLTEHPMPGVKCTRCAERGVES
jgi:hypothetical protein